mgnify:FL=1
MSGENNGRAIKLLPADIVNGDFSAVKAFIGSLDEPERSSVRENTFLFIKLSRKSIKKLNTNKSID